MILKIKLNNTKSKNGTIISSIVAIDHTRSIKSKKSLKIGSFIRPTQGLQTLFINRERLINVIANGAEFSPTARRILDSEIKLILRNNQPNEFTSNSIKQ